MVIRQKASPALTQGLWCRAHFFRRRRRPAAVREWRRFLMWGRGAGSDPAGGRGGRCAPGRDWRGCRTTPAPPRWPPARSRLCRPPAFIFQGRPAWFWPFHPTFLRTLRSEGLAPSVALAPGAFNNRSHVAMPRTSLTILPCSKKPVRPTSPRVTAIRQRTLPYDISAPTGSSSLVSGNVHRAKFSRLACNRKPKVRPGPVEQLIRAKK